MRYLLLTLLLSASLACADDADSTDTGATDTGSTDTGSTDTGSTDSGTDTTDSGNTDGNTDEGGGDGETNPQQPETDYAFILPLSNTEATWHDLAFLATIPTASKLNDGRPVVMGAEDVNDLPATTQDFLSRFTPTHAYVLDGDGSSLASVGTTHPMSASNASELALNLVNTFWQSSERLFLASTEDYRGAVLASSLAARFDAPLLFTDELSPDDLEAVQSNLGILESLLINLSGTPVEPPSGKVEALNDWESIRTWLNARTENITYIALTNVADRNSGRAQKMSLVAPMFTARRDGIVLPADFAMPMNVMTDESETPILDFWHANYAALTDTPETIALVGAYDAIAQMRRPSIFDNPIAEHPVSDLPYAEIDDDPFVDLAIGRIVSDTATEASVLASRTVNYEKLMDGTWENTFVESGLWGFDELRDIMLNAGFDAPTHPSESELRAMTFIEASAILHKDHSNCTILGNAFDTTSPSLSAPAVVLSRGCSVGGMDLVGTEQRTMVDHMLGKGAVAFIGATRNSIAENTLTEVSLWNHLLDGHTLGSAFRAGVNDLIVHWLDENQNGGPRYSIDIEILYGDPGLTYHVPSAPQTKPANATLEGNTVTVEAPEAWSLVQFLPEQLAEWDFTEDLFMYVGHGASPRTYWSGTHDNEDLYYGVNIDIAQAVTGVTETTALSSPLGWGGNYYQDLHPDGSRTLKWRVRLLDYDMRTGDINDQVDQASYQLEF